jgi:trimethylamine--corrinoid protein Co-methyltransferase
MRKYLNQDLSESINYFSISPLSITEVQDIQSASYRLLEHTGLAIHHQEVLERLESVGCLVNFESKVVKFPPNVVDKYLADIPNNFVLGRRDAGKTFKMEPGSMYTRPQSGCPNVLSLEDRSVKPANQEDVIKMTCLIDGLDHVDFCASLLYPWDVPPEQRDIRVLQLMFEHTCKHVYIQPFNGRSTKIMIEMARILRGGQEALASDPPLTFIVGGTSPLVYTPNELEVLIEIAKVGLPVMIGSTPIAGATAPVTMAGQILLQHVENIAGLVILQALRSGNPVTYAARPSFMEMRTANTTWGNIEWGMATSAVAQLAHSQDLLLDIVGLPSDSKIPDQQAAIEKAMNAVLGASSNPNVFTGVGAIETIRAGDYIQAVIDDAICGLAKRLQRGIYFDEDRMAESVIAEIGPGGNYLTEEHTVKYFRDETHRPEIFDVNMRSIWEEIGSKDIVQRARERALVIINRSNEKSIDEKLYRELEIIYESSSNGMME